ncbi:hypothetical protein PVAP13_J029060 [Panicum virgatum]|nr:hypothetical protein PVAP13_J029060 [Panicum virgatum]
MGANIDRFVNDGRGPPIFKISGQVHHRIGSLLPADGSAPKFLQLYIYDTSNEVQNRINALCPDEMPTDPIDPTIVSTQKFRMARDRLEQHIDENFVIRIVGPQERDPAQYNLPSTEQLAMLIVGDFSADSFKRDIIIETKSGYLRRIYSLHPAYMALQYPLLFPFGERGFQVDGSEMGKLTVLPASHTGGRRYMVQNYHDGIAICRVFGPPDFFVTFTCNSNWPEIDSAYIIVRVYNMKLEEMLEDIRNGNIFGTVVAVLHTVEFQKRGLPHAHIIFWVSEDTSTPTAAFIDNFISAEILDPNEDPLLYILVAEHMIHGPWFPKSFQSETTIDKNGFAVYKRPDNGRFVQKGQCRLDNRWKFQAHINVEWCNKGIFIKYLFKYVTKGPDCSKEYIECIKKGEEVAIDETTQTRNEQDACWRVFGYDVHRHFPSVERLPVHLPGENNIVYNEETNMVEVVSNEFLRRTMLTQWFEANKQYPEARTLTYLEFPSKWRWMEDRRAWEPRCLGGKIGRIYYVHPSVGEMYYLRMLLMTVKGATCFEDVRTYEGIIYETFKQACNARGLLGNDQEWYNAFDEAASWATSSQLRQLFVTMLLFCEAINEYAFFEKIFLLDDLSELFLKNGSRIEDFNLPKKIGSSHRSSETVLNNKPGFFFVSGYVISYICAHQHIVLTIASSGVASLLFPGGRTAHSRFKISCDLEEGAVCDIKRGSMLAELIKKTSLVIWDEALMTHRIAFETLDRTFRDILSVQTEEPVNIPFGGKVVVLGGGPRQILPVIENGFRQQIVNAAIINLSLWSNQGESEATWIKIPEDLILRTDGDKITCIVNSVYNDLTEKYMDASYLREQAILTPTNDIVDLVNNHVVSLIPGDAKQYLSCDRISKAPGSHESLDILYPVEFFNSLNGNNFPTHELILKKGVPIMLLRHIKQSIGLCNGTRLIVTALGNMVIEAEIMTGTHIGRIVLIPRISQILKNTKLPFTMERRQFPVKICYAMTINKSQGQTLSSVSVYLKKPVFTHGQLYVAVSRVNSKKGMKMLIEDDDGNCTDTTRNIVYSEIFSNI